MGFRSPLVPTLQPENRKPENRKIPSSLFLAKEKRRNSRKTIYGKGTRQCSTGPDTDNQRQRRQNDRFKEEEQMAMTINPANDFAINQHNQAQTRPGLENPATRVRATDNSTTQASGKKAVDSVELSSAAENIASAHSRLADFDQAQETMATLKNTIRQQAGPALQTQANISSKTAFSLLEE